MLEVILKLLKKFEFPLSILTLITFIMFSVTSVLNGDALNSIILSAITVAIAADVFSQIKERKNVKK